MYQILDESEHILRYKREATCFNEALPLGNGRIGAMVYGGVCEEKVSLNEDSLWSGYPKEDRGLPCRYERSGAGDAFMLYIGVR